MPDSGFSNSWTKEAQIKVWVPEPNVVKKVTLGFVLQRYFLFLEALLLLNELFALFGRFILQLFNELPRAVQLAPKSLKIDLELINLISGPLHFQLQGPIDGMGLIDHCS
ncbi:hypothetical protein ACOSQ2_018910 [Xanthoceras sorbifolium]